MRKIDVDCSVKRPSNGILGFCRKWTGSLYSVDEQQIIIEMKRKNSHDGANQKKKRSRGRQRCGHCQQLLSHSQYHEHRRLYFNRTLNLWKTVDSLKNVALSAAAHADVPGSSSSDSEGTFCVPST